MALNVYWMINWHLLNDIECKYLNNDNNKSSKIKKKKSSKVKPTNQTEVTMPGTFWQEVTLSLSPHRRRFFKFYCSLVFSGSTLNSVSLRWSSSWWIIWNSWLYPLEWEVNVLCYTWSFFLNFQTEIWHM